MLDISLAELFLIVVVVVIFIGPKELPHVVRAVAKAMRAMKSVTNEIKKTWDDIADTPEIKMIQGDDGKWYESYGVPAEQRESGDRVQRDNNPPIPAQGGDV